MFYNMRNTYVLTNALIHFGENARRTLTGRNINQGVGYIRPANSGERFIKK